MYLDGDEFGADTASNIHTVHTTVHTSCSALTSPYSYILSLLLPLIPPPPLHQVQYEISVEQLVLQELDNVLKVTFQARLYLYVTCCVQTDLPAISSGRKQLDRLILELDTAKARLKAAREVGHRDSLHS